MHSYICTRIVYDFDQVTKTPALTYMHTYIHTYTHTYALTHTLTHMYSYASTQPIGFIHEYPTYLINDINDQIVYPNVYHSYIYYTPSHPRTITTSTSA